MRVHLPRSLRRLLVLGFLVFVAVPLAGCFNPFSPQELTGGISTPPPTPDTPTNALRLLQWCYNNRAIAEYRELFTADYRFQFGALDKYGNAYQDQNPWTREDELASATKLFQGSTDRQAAASITLTLGLSARAQSDPRPGRNPRWHKTILASQDLSILDADQIITHVTGASLFFLARGDSALIPQELIDRGFRPDSTRWYIERWEDQSPVTEGITTGGATVTGVERRARAENAQDEEWVTWGYIKVFWR